MSDRHTPLHSRPLTRRQFLVYGGLGATALGISACTGVALPRQAPTATPPPSAGSGGDASRR